MLTSIIHQIKLYKEISGLCITSFSYFVVYDKDNPFWSSRNSNDLSRSRHLYINVFASRERTNGNGRTKQASVYCPVNKRERLKDFVHPPSPSLNFSIFKYEMCCSGTSNASVYCPGKHPGRIWSIQYIPTRSDRSFCAFSQTDQSLRAFL
jgi:hypothetical protein